MVVRQGAGGKLEEDMIAHKRLRVRTIAISKRVAGGRDFLRNDDGLLNKGFTKDWGIAQKNGRNKRLLG